MANVRYNKTPKPTVQAPRTHDEWHSLMAKALERAEKVGDRRLNGLRLALSKGNTEAHLRKIGIICLADIQREFPIPT